MRSPKPKLVTATNGVKQPRALLVSKQWHDMLHESLTVIWNFDGEPLVPGKLVPGLPVPGPVGRIACPGLAGGVDGANSSVASLAVRRVHGVQIFQNGLGKIEITLIENLAVQT